MKVLIVEDDRLVADALVRTMNAAGYTAQPFTCAEEAEAAASHERYALAIVDVGLPGQSGLELTRTLRRRGHRWPVLIITARARAEDRESALAAGANDYLPKPFGVGELIERCRKLAPPVSEPGSDIRTIGTLRVDLQQGLVLQPPLSRALSNGEWRVLAHLIRSPGSVVPLRDLMEFVDRDAEQLDLMIGCLRSLLAHAVSIRLIRGLGYQLYASPSCPESGTLTEL